MLITYKATLLQKRQLTSDVFLFKFSYPEDPNFSFKAGQYMIVHVPQGEELPAKRLYSIGSPPCRKDAIELIIQLVPQGIGSTYLSQLQEGAIVTLQGPAGLFTIKDESKDIIFLATGTGIAPIRSMIEDLCAIETSTTRLTLFWGLKTYEDVYLFEELKQLAQKYPRFSFLICLSRETDLNHVPEEIRTYFRLGRITNELDKMIEANKQAAFNDIFYICGGKDVIEAMKKDLYSRNIPPTQIHFEKFT
jgi:ferredoxin-NADP reductase